MIISHKYKFIFIKTNKTAGTSVEIALSKFCGPDDIITPITADDEKIRKELGYPGPQNHLASLTNYGLKDIVRFVLTGKKKNKFYNHISAREVKMHVGQQVWDDYFKFCIERNPWDRVVSFYYWKYKSKSRPSIADYIKSKSWLALKHRGRELYTLNGQVAVNKICYFENLADELEVIRLQLGIPKMLSLPNAKSHFRKDKQSYRDILDKDSESIIAEVFSEEINLLGYTF